MLCIQRRTDKDFINKQYAKEMIMNLDEGFLYLKCETEETLNRQYVNVLLDFE